ncbi:hypothetical protein IHV25_04390 [Phaeovibrio sulfidiphilus]|uniref:Uncharacterized protein n=1 Tax=Phaeovibrio sulfidiphilus TaxID=1220600 RepID=A0A8J6YUY2_9PROT|nr:hypothetical protein [Phaeovibrio sulfidiphilus]MBE1236884.1 hypothetical protein [Phaeovibrio sulfidiphilus]
MSGHDIRFAGTAASRSAYAPLDTSLATGMPAAPTPAAATGQTPSESLVSPIKINPRTILDPDLYVNVAQFAWGDQISFQVPSRERVIAYQELQAAQTTKETVVQPREVAEANAMTREATHTVGDGAPEVQAAATVVASTAPAMVSTPADTGTVRREDNANPSGRPQTTPTVHKVDLEG